VYLFHVLFETPILGYIIWTLSLACFKTTSHSMAGSLPCGALPRLSSDIAEYPEIEIVLGVVTSKLGTAAFAFVGETVIVTACKLCPWGRHFPATFESLRECIMSSS
jgi:hypothetical protein